MRSDNSWAVSFGSGWAASTIIGSYYRTHDAVGLKGSRGWQPRLPPLQSAMRDQLRASQRCSPLPEAAFQQDEVEGTGDAVPVVVRIRIGGHAKGSFEQGEVG